MTYKVMTPIAWYDPTNGVVSTDKNDSRFTPAGQIVPLVIEQAQKQEPFCYVNVNSQGDVTRTVKRKDAWCKTPLYTSPPQRQPLTDEEILHRVDTHVGTPSPRFPLDNRDWINFARAIEAAHGIKGEV